MSAAHDGNRHETSTQAKESETMTKETREAAQRMRDLDSNISMDLDRILSDLRASSIDSSRSLNLSELEVEPPQPSATLLDDPGFSRALEVLEKQADMVRDLSSAFTEYVESSERESKRSHVFNALSLAVAVLSLAVTFVSLLGQFGALK